MKHVGRIILVIATLITLAACSLGNETAIVTATKNAGPTRTTTVSAAKTSLPPQATATVEPSPTLTSAAIPPTFTPVPFLLGDLRTIDASNISAIKLLTSLPVKEIYDLAFSSIGHKLATLSEPWDDRFNDYMEVWDLTNGMQILRVDKWRSPSGLFFPPAETTLYADKRLYDLASGKVVTTLDLAPRSFSPDGKSYAASEYMDTADESAIKIIDAVTGRELLGFTHPGMVMALHFSPSGNLLIGSIQVVNNFVIKVWEASSGEVIADLVNYDTGLAVSPDGSLAAAVKNGQVYIFAGESFSYLASYPFMDPESIPDTVEFSPAGDILAIEDKYSIHFLVPESGKELFVLPDECMVKFSPAGNLLVTWCYQGDLKIWGVGG